MLALVAAIQLGWSEPRFLADATRAARTQQQQDQLPTSAARLATAHVPPRESLLYVTADPTGLMSYFELSYALVGRNRVWWATPAARNTTVDWWIDSTGGAAALKRIADRHHVRFIVFERLPPATGLLIIASWRDGSTTLVQLGG